MNYQINGKSFTSIKKPLMRHVRIGGQLLAMQEGLDNQEAMYAYLNIIFEHILSIFPTMKEKDLDSLEIEQLMPLVNRISRWINGGGDNQQKKNTQQPANTIKRY